MRKQLLYLTNTELTAHQWQRGRLSDGTTFQNDESGWQALSEYLADNLHVPAFLLMDLIEEDFHRDTMPHVLGKARRALIDRRLLQLYRDTPFRHASHQGREKTGRRDDVMLFSALTNAPLLKPWIDAILKLQVPVAGIFSTALLSTLLFKKFHGGKEPVLLITHQSAGLRQNFFYNGYLRFSRLTKLPVPGADDNADSAENYADTVAEVVRAEIGKTRLFLANTRQLQRGETLKVIALDSTATLQSLHNLNLDSDTVTTQFIAPDEACHALGLKHLSEITVFDRLFLTLLATKSPNSHYQLLEQSHAYTLWKTRIIMYLLSAATVAGCVLWSISNTMDALDAGNRFKFLERETVRYMQRYQDVLSSTPKTVQNAHDMKAVVALHEVIAQNTSSPTYLMQQISQVLNRMPQLSLNEMKWEVTDQKDFSANTTTAAAVTPEPAAVPNAPVSATLVGVPLKPSEIVELQGEVLPFKNNYRSALDSVNAFTQELMKNKNIQVIVLQQPLDIRSSVPLTGEAGNEDSGDAPAPTAKFALKIIWIP